MIAMCRGTLAPLSLMALALALGACGSVPSADTPGTAVEDRHLTAPPASPEAVIPDIVRPLPVVSPPQPQPPMELFSVVVQDVQVRELLFDMARDAGINVDVHSGVAGTISLNAIDQTLPQLLERIARQVDIRWRFERSDYLIVEPDAPFLRSYQVDYVNIARSTAS